MKRRKFSREFKLAAGLRSGRHAPGRGSAKPVGRGRTETPARREPAAQNGTRHFKKKRRPSSPAKIAEAEVHRRAPIALPALDQANTLRKPPAGLIVHSDRRSQFASAAYRRRLNKHGFLQSMSRKRNCYDNAPMESFFRSFEVEEVCHETYETHEQAVRGANDSIERFYNSKRLHSALDSLSPLEFEKRLLQREHCRFERQLEEKSALVGAYRESK